MDLLLEDLLDDIDIINKKINKNGEDISYVKIRQIREEFKKNIW